MSEAGAIPAMSSNQDTLYEEAAAEYGAAIERLARAYEAEPETRRDLLQEIHIAIWRSFVSFDGRCSLRTWIYRVAHNVATSHAIRQRRAKGYGLIGLEEMENLPETLTLWYGLIAIFFIIVWRLNVRAARCLQRMLDDLRATEQSK